MFLIQLTIQYIVPTLALIALGAYLEHRFGSKVTSRVAAVEAQVASVAKTVESAKDSVRAAVETKKA